MILKLKDLDKTKEYVVKMTDSSYQKIVYLDTHKDWYYYDKEKDRIFLAVLVEEIYYIESSPEMYL